MLPIGGLLPGIFHILTYLPCNVGDTDCHFNHSFRACSLERELVISTTFSALVLMKCAITFLPLVLVAHYIQLA